MPNEITTSGIEDQFLEIIKDFVDLFKENPVLKKSYDEHLLILMKIASNLFSGCILWSRGRSDDAKIIIRSAFESLVLFDYLVAYPDELTRYIQDSKIIIFKNHFAFLKRGHSTEEDLVKNYTILDEDVKKLLPLEMTEGGIVSFDLNLLDSFFKKFKPLAQQTRTMMEALLKEKTHNAEEIQYISLLTYTINSQVAHGTLDTLVNTYTKFPTDSEKLEQIKDCNRQSISIIYMVEKSLKKIIGDINIGPMAKKIMELYRYLGYDLSAYEKPKKPISDIIQVITFS